MSFLRAKPSRKACASNDWCLPSPAMNKPPGNFLWSSKKESAKKYALGHADLNIFAVGLTQVRFLSMVRAVTVNWGSTSKSLDTAIIALSISRNNNNTALPQQPTATTSAAPCLPPLARYNLLPPPLLQSTAAAPPAFAVVAALASFAHWEPASRLQLQLPVQDDLNRSRRERRVEFLSEQLRGVPAPRHLKINENDTTPALQQPVEAQP